MNKCIFSGRLVRHADLIKLANDKQMIKFTMAVNDVYKTGEHVTSYPEFIGFGNIAKLQFNKGTLLEVVARYSNSSYTTDKGETRHNKYFVLESVNFLEKKYTNDNNAVNEDKTQSNEYEEMLEDEIPENIPF